MAAHQHNRWRIDAYASENLSRSFRLSQLRETNDQALHAELCVQRPLGPIGRRGVGRGFGAVKRRRDRPVTTVSYRRLLMRNARVRKAYSCHAELIEYYRHCELIQLDSVPCSLDGSILWIPRPPHADHMT